MNEKIRQFAKQAGAYWNHGDFNMGSSVEFQESDLDKFAELMINEFIAVLDRRIIGDRNREEQEVQWCINDVRRHFGVEE